MLMMQHKKSLNTNTHLTVWASKHNKQIAVDILPKLPTHTYRRNDLYCAERDVKLYSTLPYQYHTKTQSVVASCSGSQCSTAKRRHRTVYHVLSLFTSQLSLILACHTLRDGQA